MIKKGPFIADTDTVPGIFANIFDNKAIDEIYKLKARSSDKPLALYGYSIEQINNKLCGSLLLNNQQIEFIRAIVPGQYTFLIRFDKLKISFDLNENISLNNKIAIRIPNNKVILDFCKTHDVILCGTSANISGDKPMLNINIATKFFQIKSLYEILNINKDINQKFSNIPSTIIDMNENINDLKIIRYGSKKSIDKIKKFINNIY